MEEGALSFWSRNAVLPEESAGGLYFIPATLLKSILRIIPSTMVGILSVKLVAHLSPTVRASTWPNFQDVMWTIKLFVLCCEENRCQAHPCMGQPPTSQDIGL
eukprot:scaffold94650_cov17-Tisochrysis_lutea.AAC.1